MTHLFIGIGDAGEAILDALLGYKAVRRAKPIVLKTKPESDKEDKIEGTLKNIKDVDVAFLFSGLGDSDLTPLYSRNTHRGKHKDISCWHCACE